MRPFRLSPNSPVQRTLRTGAAHRSQLVARLLLVGFVTATLAGVWGGMAGVLKLAYPAGALAVGLVLHRKEPALYMGFVWWLWFLSPLVRRLIDYQVGYDSVNPVLVAPVLVTGLSVLSLFRHFPKLQRRSLIAFFPVLASLVYAYPIGIANTGLQAATFSLLQWLVPVVFGFHLATDALRYPEYQATIRRVFTWAALGLGVYGVWQFLNPAAWDLFWMANTAMGTIGPSIPLEVRVFSTVNSPTPFAMVMLAGLLMLLGTRAIAHVLIGIPAYFAFLLSLVRTAWGGWLLGVGVYATYLPARIRVRLFVMIAFLAVGIGALTASPIGGRIDRRIESLADLGEDKSLTVREASAGMILELILDDPLGRGLGATGSARRLSTGGRAFFDNGVLNLFFSLGWLGGLLYLGGTLTLLAGLLRRFEPRGDPIPKVARAVSFATFAALASLNTLIGVSGVLFWGFLGLSISARGWYRSAQVELTSTPARVGTVRYANAGR